MCFLAINNLSIYLSTCIAKERSMPARTREHVLSLTGYFGEKLYVDLVSMSDNVRGNTCSQRKIVSVDTVTHIQSQIRQCALRPRYWWISISTSMGSQINSTRIKVKNLLTTCGENCSPNSRYSILHTTPPNDSSPNPVACFHRTLITMLWIRGEGIQDNWDRWINASVFAYNTTVSSSTGVAPH